MSKKSKAKKTSSGSSTCSDEQLRLLLSIHPRTSAGSATTEFAAWLARTTCVRVQAVGTFLRPWPLNGLSKISGRYEKWLSSHGLKYAKKIRKIFKSADIDPSVWDEVPAVIKDGPSEAALILEAADAFDADLVVLASEGSAAATGFEADSVTEALLHSSPRHLGLVPQGVKLSKRGVTRINVAMLKTDLEANRALLEYSADLAAHWELPVRLVAFSPRGLTSPKDDLPIDLSRDAHKEWHEFALSILDRARDLIGSNHHQLEVDTSIAAGGGWAAAYDAINWKKGDLLCLGSTPMGSLSRVFLGSTETEFLRHVRVPVIVIPPARN